MKEETYTQQVTGLHHLIADQIEAYADSHPDLPASVVLAAVGEALVNLGVRQMGSDYTIDLCHQLIEAIQKTKH